MVDLGRCDLAKNEADWGAFKTPTLRNISQRGPYRHDGTFPPVNDALGHSMEGGSLNPQLEKEIHALGFLSFGEREDILAFLDSLTAPVPDNLRPPAGLTTKQTAQNG
jgi:cytochrome c peroxidase